ncbi:hypothetical protein [Agrobacterium sp. CG674]
MSKKWAVTKGHDALIYYEKVFTAETAEEANQLADADKYGEGWHSIQETAEYDHCDIIKERTEEFVPEDEPTTLTLLPAERDVIIAALRHWQAAEDSVPEALIGLATNGREDHLTDSEIDTLIEGKINV